MRLHRFYSKQRIDVQNQISIDDLDLIRQLTKVFRYKKGDRIIFFDGSGSDFVCQIDEIRKDAGLFSVIETMKCPFILSKEINLFVSIIKKDKFEWIVEKATEIGINKIIPILTERSEKKDLNIERINKIAIEASEQSGRGSIPTIENIISFREALEYKPDIILDLFGNEFDSKKYSAKQKINILIGPEGGWSDTERQVFKNNGLHTTCLGKQTLKTETASIVISGLLSF